MELKATDDDNGSSCTSTPGPSVPGRLRRLWLPNRRLSRFIAAGQGVAIGPTRYQNGEFLAQATYLHDGSENHEDSFSYTASDGGENSVSERATANVTVISQ